MRSTRERVEAYIADPQHISDEQRAAILSDARLTIVRACPGSGKTRAFSARFAWDVATASSHRHGVAAVSFTNVAQEEVRRRVRTLEINDGHPHFVGTIDAFLLRYVVRRFGGQIVNLKRFSHPVPDRDFSVQSEPFQYGFDSKQRDRLASFRIGAATATSSQMEHVSRDQTVTVVPQQFKQQILDAKMAAWNEGEVTHSDVVAIAWRILSAPTVASIVARRFPRILVDELQDTTGVRELCLRLLFRSPEFDRGFVVGDPDQCIMDFAGADPKLFEQLAEVVPDDTKEFAFTTCHRFHDRIAAVTAPLRESGVAVNAVRAKSPRSATILLTHAFTPKPKDGVVAGVTVAFEQLCRDRDIPNRKSIVLAWMNDDVQRLGGLQKKHMPLTAPSYGQVMGAVRAFSEAKVLEAFRKTERLLSKIVFGLGRPPSHDELSDKALDARRWRSLVMRTLMQTVERGAGGETVDQWAERVKAIYQSAVEKVTGAPAKLGPKFPKRVDAKKLLTAVAEQYLPDAQSGASLAVSNIHQVKGQEYDAVCMYIPADWKGMEPAESILAGGLATGEILSTRRVWYVGATRAMDLLVIAVPQSWIAALEAHPKGQAFLAGFDERRAL